MHPIDVTMLGYALASGGDAAALPLAERLRSQSPADAAAIAAVYHDARGNHEAATTALLHAFDSLRSVPWQHSRVQQHALRLAWRIAGAHPSALTPLIEALRQPFAVRVLEEHRFRMHAAIALDMGPGERCAEAIESIEPWVPWDEEYLRERLECYERVGGPHLQRARDDLAEFLAAMPPAGGAGDPKAVASEH